VQIIYLARIGYLARPIESVHTSNVRTNVNLADDARQFAEVYAHANGITLGEAITDLVRKGGKAASLPAGTVEFRRSAAGFPTFPPNGRVITTEMVKEALEDFI
jgi:hypothetical protein